MDTIEELCDVDVAALADWLKTVPIEDWPKMADTAFQGWGDKFRPLAASLTLRHYPGCSVSGIGMFILEPGQLHPTHKDVQPPNWVTRVHVPIVTNDLATATTDEGVYHMQIGKAYRFDTRKNHAVFNGGETPRAHFIFDVVA